MRFFWCWCFANLQGSSLIIAHAHSFVGKPYTYPQRGQNAFSKWLAERQNQPKRKVNDRDREVAPEEDVTEDLDALLEEDDADLHAEEGKSV